MAQANQIISVFHAPARVARVRRVRRRVAWAILMPPIRLLRRAIESQYGAKA